MDRGDSHKLNGCQMLNGCQKKNRILVIGDMIFAKGEDGFDLAGTAKIASLASKLGCPVLLAGVVGMDEEGNMLKQKLKIEGIPLILGMLSTNSPSARGGPGIFQDILKVIALLSDDLKLIALCDLGKGLLTGELVKAIMEVCRHKDIFVLVYVRCDSLSKYSGADMVVIGFDSLKHLPGKSPGAQPEPDDAAHVVFSGTGCTACAVLYGTRGAYLFSGTGRMIHIPCKSLVQTDNSDEAEYVFMAVLSAGLSRGMSPEEAIAAACNTVSVPVPESHP